MFEPPGVNAPLRVPWPRPTVSTAVTPVPTASHFPTVQIPSTTTAQSLLRLFYFDFRLRLVTRQLHLKT